MNYIVLAASALSLASAQQVGTNTAEKHPSLNVATCTAAGGCSTKAQSIVLDANWRWIHTTGGYTNCYTGQTWNTTICPDSKTCTSACAVDGADYSGTYGITTADSTVNLGFVTQGSGSSNIGSRIYLMQDENNYQTFNLLNGEFAFDVDVSQLPCGLNGALYFSQMDQDGGMKRFPTNKAGATFGTGYCDAQCPRDLKFPQGESNVEGWTPSKNDPNSGTGNLGSCCSEMDIWEANSMASAYTAHPCSVDSSTTCTDAACTSSCDPAGCDFNSWRMGNQSFYGPGLTIDTKSRITVVTQFVTDDNTNQGNLVQINRFYVQNGNVIPNSYASVTGVDPVNSISDNYCSQAKKAFTEDNVFANMGGLKKMGAAFKTGMVLVMSIWDDHNANNLWLDSEYPLTSDASSPGVSRGPCSRSSGVPADVEKASPNAKVSFSNIKWGELNSTFSGGNNGNSNPGNPGTPSPSSSAILSSSAAEAPIPSSTVTTASADPINSDTVTAAAASTTTPSSGCPAKGKVSSSDSPAPSSPASNNPSTGDNCVARWWQCGGQGYTGPTCCQAGSTCTELNQWYSQCM